MRTPFHSKNLYRKLNIQARYEKERACKHRQHSARCEQYDPLSRKNHQALRGGHYGGQRLAWQQQPLYKFPFLSDGASIDGSVLA